MRRITGSLRVRGNSFGLKPALELRVCNPNGLGASLNQDSKVGTLDNMNTVIIAQALGIFFVVMGASMVIRKHATAAALEEAVSNRGYLWMWGLLAVIMGAVIIPLNSVWTSGLPLIITVVGWLALIKGTFILIFPDATVSLYRKINKDVILVLVGVVAFIFGLVLLYW
jgi:hypothetical protein